MDAKVRAKLFALSLPYRGNAPFLRMLGLGGGDTGCPQVTISSEALLIL